MTELRLQFLLAAREELSRAAGTAETGLEKLEKRFEKLRRASEKLEDAGRTIAGLGAVITGGVALGVKAFSDLEQSAVSLQNVMGTVDGMDEHFDSINRKAIALGNRLPGATRDFYDLATALRRGGAASGDLDNGLLEAAANLKVVQRLSSEVAGEGLATTAMAFKLNGQEAIAYADIINRTANASRLKVTGFFEAMKFVGAPAKMMGLEGLKSATEMSTLMAALSNTGIDPSQVGTAFSNGVAHMAGLKTRLLAARGALWGESGDILSQKGIRLDFFDESGNTSVPRIIAQLDKLKALTNEQRTKVGQTLFGAEGARLALVGSAEFNAMVERQLKVEHLNKQIDRETGTLSGKFENLFGTASNAAARFFAPVAEGLKGVLTRANSLVDKIDGWVERNPRLAATIAWVVTALGGLLVVGGGALWMVSKLINAWFALKGALFVIGPVLTFAKTAVIGLTQSLWGMAAAFFATPVGWIVAAVAAIAGAGYLLWKNWDRLAGWVKTNLPGVHAAFTSAWAGLKSAFASLWAALTPLWEQFKTGLRMLMDALKPVWSALGFLWEKIKPFAMGSLKGLLIGLFLPLAVALGTFAAAVFIVIKALTWLVQGFTWLVQKGQAVISFLGGLAGTFFRAGSNIMTSIGKGMLAAVNHPIEAIKAVVKKIRGFLPFSPAKEGPLMDIHKIRLVETIAEGMNPGAIVGKMQAIAGAARNLVPRMVGAGMTVAAAPLAFAGGMGGGRAPIQITIQVDARGAAPGVQQDIERAVMRTVPAIKRELERLGVGDSRRKF